MGNFNMIQNLLIAIGIPKELALFIGGLGVEWGVLVAILGVLLRFVIIPFAAKWVEEKRSNTQTVLTTLSEIKDAIVKTTNKQEERDDTLAKIKNMTEEILSDSVGNCDSSLALSTFASYMANIHLRTETYFWRRVRTNHILDNPDIISGRYANESDKLAGKIITQLSKYHYRSLPLSFFWGKTGAESYMRHLFTELYSVQYNRASGDPDATKITDEILSERIDHNLSILMGMFQKWMENPDCTFSNTKNDYDLRLFGKTLNKPEML